MKFKPQLISDVILIEPKIHGDNRGYFVETFRQGLLEKELGYKINFIQDNESKSSKGVLRGLHYQKPPYSQAKLVRVIDGRVLDVVVDIRITSPTFGKHVAVILDSEQKKQLFIPHGFAHGFVVLSETAIFSYKVDNFYAPNSERGIAFNDKSLDINWQLPHDQLLISDKDKKNPSLEHLEQS